MIEGWREGWSDRVIDILRSLWAEGLSGAEIGRRIGFSKNAVIGKAHRLGLPKRPSPIKNADGTTRTNTERQARMAENAARQGRPLEGSAGLQIAKRRQGNGTVIGPTLSVVQCRPPPRPVYVGASRACCWPHGDPKAADFFFCGEPSVNGRSYCPTHLRVAYKPRQEATAGSHDDVSSQNSRGTSDSAPPFLADPSDQATPSDAPHTEDNVRGAG